MDAGPLPEHERGQQRRERDDQRRALRPRVVEPGEPEQVEAGEAERAEPPEPQPPSVEAERFATLDGCEDREEHEPGQRVADGGEMEGIHPLDRRLADDELPAPGEPGSGSECRSN
jgi:hypothetical protein